MSIHFRTLATSASLVAFLGCSLACGGATAPAIKPAFAARCADAAGAHHAWVVVKHASGSVLQRCVGFDQQSEPALDLMRRGGIALSTQNFAFGTAVCSIDKEPAHYSKCLPAGAPYWALFVATAGGPWKLAATGVSAVKVNEGDALGWNYVPASVTNPPPPPLPPKS